MYLAECIRISLYVTELNPSAFVQSIYKKRASYCQARQKAAARQLKTAARTALSRLNLYSTIPLWQDLTVG